MHPIVTSLIESAFIAASRLAKRRFDAQAPRAGEVNRDLLLRILRRQEDTEFGRRHDFRSLRSVQDFQRALPVSTYDDIRADIERMARGEANVLTRDPVVAFGLSSGTTGNQKLIPFTTYANRRSVNLSLIMRGAVYEAIPASRRGGRGILLMSGVMAGKTEGGFPTGAATALVVNDMLKGRLKFWNSPDEVFLIRKQTDAHYLHLLFGLAHPGLTTLNAPFASGLLDFFQLLEARWPALVDDLGRGTLSADVTLAPELDAPIRARLRAHPARARALGREFEKGFSGIARRIWPALSHASAITGGSFHLYADKLTGYLGDLPLISSFYGATEAMMGVNLGTDKPVYAMLPTSAFWEFIPADELDAERPSTRLLDEVTRGERYEIVLTTFTGLYRYRLGDVIEVVDHHGRTPVVEFVHRRGSLLNIAGEKTSEQAARHALTEALSRAGMELVDFSTMEDLGATPKRYVFFVELDARGQPVDVPQLAEWLEEALRRANPFYATLRARFGPIALYPVQPGTFRALRELLISRGASPSQVKIPRVVTEGPLSQLLMDRRVGA